MGKVNSNDIARLSIRGAQCGYRLLWSSSSSTINYERLLLDTGRGSLDISSGEWTAEEKGLYQVSWSLRNVPGPDNRIYLYKNGAQLPESLHASWTYGADIAEQGGRSTPDSTSEPPASLEMPPTSSSVSTSCQLIEGF